MEKASTRLSADAARFALTGLWPLVVEEAFDLEGDSDGLELGDALTVLTTGWEDAASIDDPQRLVPFSPGTFPGLAASSPDSPWTPAAESALASLEDDLGLLLVPVTRPADVLLALAWGGAWNYDLDGGQLSAVLRTWEERYATIPVGIGVNSLALAVRRPPTGELAMRVAAEQFALCPDSVDQGVLSIRALAASISGAPVWSLWWD
jgi:hypothetical protein